MTGSHDLQPITNFVQARDYLHSFVDFERRGFRRHFADVVSLDTIRALLDLLGNPHRGLRSVHIAGTKAKGSVAAILEAALRDADYITGLYTSPHLVSPAERIRINGFTVSEQQVVELVRTVQPAAENIRSCTELAPPTFFEIYTAMAFVAFAQGGVDIAVIEAGLGGRLDATNVLTPLVAVITPISYDHTEILGDTLAQIAAEKAGIIKPHIPVVVAPQLPEASQEVLAHAQQCQAPVITPPPVAEYAPVVPLPMPGPDEPLPALTQSFALTVDTQQLWVTTYLVGEHQAHNATVAYATLSTLAPQGFAVEDTCFVEAMARVNWPARFQLVAARPWLILDCAHNPASAAALAAALPRHLTYNKLIVVIGISADKDITGVIHALGQVADEFVVTQARHPRAVPATELSAALSSQWSGPVHSSGTVPEALTAAQRMAGPADAICVTGSFFVVGEAMQELGLE